MGNSGSSESRRDIENLYFLSEAKFIAFLQNTYLKPVEKGKIEKNRINDQVNLYGDTLLHYAVFHNKKDLVDFLLKNQANPFQENLRKQTPYSIAQRKNLNHFIQKFNEKKK